jgi:hypothetical protein
MRGWVCNFLVQLLLGLASAVTLESKSHRTHYLILLSQLRIIQHGESGPHIYISQEQGGPVIPPRTGFPCHPFLRLTGLWWKYSNQPPHKYHPKLKLKLKLIYDRQSVGLSVLVSGAHLGPLTNFSFSLKFLSDVCVFVIL